VLAARIDRLAPRDKTVLQAASVIGREFPRTVLEHVTDVDATELDDALHQLVAGGLVYEQDVHPESIFAFEHPLTREVAYRSLLAERRVTLHAAVARAVISNHPERLDERSALLAQHWEAGGRMPEAAHWHARAAAWSGTADPARALEHWRKVRDLADALPDSAAAAQLRLQARTSLLNYGWRLGIGRDEREALFTETERMASQLDDPVARALLLFAYGAAIGLGEGRQLESAALQREALALAEDAGDAALYVGLSLGAYSSFIVGDYQEAVAIYDRAIELAGGDPTMGAGIILAGPYANCHIFKGLALAPLGRLEEARRLFEQGRAIAEEQRDIEVVGWSHMWSVWVAYFSGLPDAAVAHGREALRIAERIGGSFSQTVAWFHMGGAELMRGDWPRAIEALERSAETARANRHGEHDGWRLALLGEAYLADGDADRARGLAAEGAEVAHERGILFEETHATLALARVLLGSVGTNAGDEIEQALGRAATLAHETGARAFEPLVHVERAEFARLCGDHDGCEHELREAHRLFLQIDAFGHARRLAADLGLTGHQL
jgi:adenylate cyclase